MVLVRGGELENIEKNLWSQVKKLYTKHVWPVWFEPVVPDHDKELPTRLLYRLRLPSFYPHRVEGRLTILNSFFTKLVPGLA